MLTTTLLVMLLATVAVLLMGMLAGRPAAHARHAGRGPNGDAGWVDPLFSGGDNCTAGDAGCDGGGGAD